MSYFLQSALLFFTLCLSAGLLAVTPAATKTGEAKIAQDIQLSQIETQAWLGLIDKGSYGESWEKGSLMFRNTIKKEEWIKAMDKVRKPIGSLLDRTNLDIRTSKDPQGLPSGDYMVYVYESSFAHKKSAHELVTLVQESDGRWRVLTYQID